MQYQINEKLIYNIDMCQHDVYIYINYKRKEKLITKNPFAKNSNNCLDFVGYWFKHKGMVHF